MIYLDIFSGHSGIIPVQFDFNIGKKKHIDSAYG